MFMNSFNSFSYCKKRSFKLLSALLLIGCLSFTNLSYADVVQHSVIEGIVVDAQNAPIIGANIIEKGTTNGIISDLDGKFSLQVSNRNGVLVVSYIGYITQEVSIGNANNIRIVLEEDVQQLEEMVVVGYQTMRKTDLTGAVASIKAGELNLTTPSVGQSMVGKVPGVQISQVSGAPYVGTKIRVRGTASINASSDPLYVIDGYPSNEDIFLNPNDIESIEVLKDAASAAIYGSRAAGGVVLITTKRGKEGKTQVNYDYQFGITQLAKKIDMLNAMEFAELYVDGRNNNYKNLMVNAGKAWDDSMFSDTNEKRAERLGASNSGVNIPDFLYDFENQKVLKPEYDTDWQDELYRNAPTHRHNISIAGGSNRVKYQISLGYQDQKGIIVTTGQKRLNVRSNIDIDVNKRLKVGTSLASTSTWNREVREGRFHIGPILGALVYAPIFKPYNEDGSFAKNEMGSMSSMYALQSIENPVALASETKINRNGVRNTYNVFGTYELVDNLFLKANLGTYNFTEKYEFYQPTSLSSGRYPPYSPQAIAAAYARAKNTNVSDYLGEFTLNYNKSFNDIHNFSGVAGYSLQYHKNDVLEVNAKGFQDDHITEVTGHGADPSDLSLTNSTGKSIWTIISYFTRLNYNYQNRYYLTASFRGDASSLFGPKNRWGYFPSVSAAWNISNEPFYKNAFGNNSILKLRASWGRSGNNDIGNYNFIQVMSSPEGTVFGNGSLAPAMYPLDFKDEYLGWESTSQFNTGADLSLFNGRLAVSANYYNSLTFDLLFDQTISALSGSTKMLTNLRESKIRNRGFDLQLDGRILAHKDYDLTIGANTSANRNKVLDLGGASTIITNGAERSYKTHITMEGQPIGMFYGFKVLGIVRESDMANIAEDDKHYNEATKSFPEGYKLKGPARSLSQSIKLQPGDLYFEDVNGDGVVDDDDKAIIGSPHPDFIFGININGRYKNIDLSASFNGSVGNEVLDGQDYYIFNMEGSGNQYKEVTQRYRNEQNPGNGRIYKASRGGTQSNSTRLSTFYLQDGSFLRMTNLTLGYSLPAIAKYTRNNIQKLRLYLAIDNPFTLTKYKGYNPEVDYNNGANLTPGVDYGKYPLVRAYNFGIQLTF